MRARVPPPPRVDSRPDLLLPLLALACSLARAADLITYHTAIACMRRAGTKRAARRAIGLVRSMMRPHPGPALTPSVIGFTGAITACNAAGEWAGAVALYGRMERAGVAGDAIAMQQALLASARGGHWRSALHLISRMQEERAAGSPRGGGAERSDGGRGERGRRDGRGGRGGRGRGGRGRGRGATSRSIPAISHADALSLGAQACRTAGKLGLAEQLEAKAATARGRPRA